MTSILDKVRALGEENWPAQVTDLHGMEREAIRIFHGHHGRIPTHGELEEELRRLFPSQFRQPPPRKAVTFCPHCGRPMDETFNPADIPDEDDIPF